MKNMNFRNNTFKSNVKNNSLDTTRLYLHQSDRKMFPELIFKVNKIDRQRWAGIDLIINFNIGQK